MSRHSTLISSPLWSTLLLGASTALFATGAAGAQEDVHFTTNGTSSNVGCPPEIQGIYFAPDKGITFFGNSFKQPETGGDYVYKFTGKNLQNTWKVTGTFKVKSFQCPIAWYGFIFGLPTIIATLHDPQITRLTASNGGCDPTMVTYDPYSEEQECPPPDEGADGSGYEGSGTYYQEGDHTGGETVNWQTGQGNGGSSVCGADAVVQYVCIETFNEGTGLWEIYSCGYATTC